MSCLIRIAETEVVSQHDNPIAVSPAAGSTWAIQLTTPVGERQISLTDPFARYTSLNNKPEDVVQWYLEEYFREPFEATKAAEAADLIREYGKSLATQLSSHGVLPRQGHLEIEVATPYRGNGQQEESQPGSTWSQSSLNVLHWEVLEDITVWPSDHNFSSVAVCRTTTLPSRESKDSIEKEPAQNGQLHAKKRFNILLVVSRPKGDRDIEYQLVSRYLVAITVRIQKDNPDVQVSLDLLRPPTWDAFEDALKQRRYDLVHLDMHGEIEKKEDGTARGMLLFCEKQNPARPLKTKKDKRSADEIGEVLARAKVPTVIINACQSAKSQAGMVRGNLAETLIYCGLQSVVAMSFKIVDEAVEIFTNEFYQSLLVRNLSVRESTRLSRVALLQNQQRRARHMYSIQLLDYVVPILYSQSSGQKEMSLSKNVASMGLSFSSSIFQPLLYAFGQLGLTHRSDQRTTPLLPETQDIVGRDGDVLRLELILSTEKMILLHGSGGCGKSTLLQYCRDWWKSSGWIKNSALIDLSERHWHNSSFEKILDSVGEQFDIPAADRSENKILRTLQNEECLLVVDSLECLSTPVSLDFVRLANKDIGRLRQFLNSASQQKSKSIVILSSRQDDDSFVIDDMECPRYPLTGLGTLAGTQLFEKLAYPNQTNVPEALRHRHNIDLIRRAVILLEGNPAALNLAAPGLRRLGNDPQALLDNLLYDVFETVDEDRFNCRFARTVAVLLGEMEWFSSHESVVFPCQIAPFWTIIPEDPRYYFWFLLLEHMKYFQEGSYATWLTEDFQTAVESFVTQHQIDSDWRWMCSRLENGGLLEEAVMETETEKKINCYHVHPIVSLLIRSRPQKDRWPSMKFAYVRQFLLWVPMSAMSDRSEICSISWDGLQQHEDYVTYLKAIAMRYSLEEPDLGAQVARAGWSMFDLVHLHSLNSFHKNKRPARFLLPLVRQHLNRLYLAVVQSRSGNIPNGYQLEMIMDYSWELYDNEHGAPEAANVIMPALEMVSRWRNANPGVTLSDTKQLTLFQLRHAEACIAIRREGSLTAKELFERNLGDDADEENSMYRAIRRIQLRNLQEWALCVGEQMQLDGAIFDQNAIREVLSQTPLGNGGVEGLMSYLAREHPNVWEELTMKDALAHVLEPNQAIFAQFSNLTRRILNESLAMNFADHPGVTPQSILDLLNSAGPGADRARSNLAHIDSGIRMFLGDTQGAAQALSSLLGQEAPDSISSNGWEAIAELHHALYDIAVPREGTRDYWQGLTHLNEYFRLLQGAPHVPARELYYTHIKFATCYNGLVMVADAGRAILAAVPLIPVVQLSECVNEMDQEEFEMWMFERIAEMTAMDIFLDERCISFAPPGAEELTIVERTLLHQVVVKAKACQRARAEMDEAYGRLREMIGRLQETLRRSDQ